MSKKHDAYDANASAIDALREQLKDEVVILGHHYQQQGIVNHCDFLGDSLELSRRVAAVTAQRIVFCGVYFMAESAALLARSDQSVYLPEHNADCVMALMTPAALLDRILTRLAASGRRLVPLAYVNTFMDVKAVVGRHGGAVCTSANAERMLEWALREGDGVLFLPDKNLGQNTARKLGLSGTDIHLLDIRKRGEALDLDAASKAALLCWPGLCAVHARFTPAHIEAARAADPACRIVVHPECSPEVTQAADAAGSTSFIIDFVRSAPQGAHIVIGTEINLVRRLEREYADRVKVDPLFPSSCSHMAKVTPAKLRHTLEQIRKHTAAPVSVPAQDAAPARATLERMLDVCA